MNYVSLEFIKCVEGKLPAFSRGFANVHAPLKSNLVTTVPAAPGCAWGQNGGGDVIVSGFKQPCNV